MRGRISPRLPPSQAGPIDDTTFRRSCAGRSSGSGCARHAPWRSIRVGQILVSWIRLRRSSVWTRSPDVRSARLGVMTRKAMPARCEPGVLGRDTVGCPPTPVGSCEQRDASEVLGEAAKSRVVCFEYRPVACAVFCRVLCCVGSSGGRPSAELHSVRRLSSPIAWLGSVAVRWPARL